MIIIKTIFHWFLSLPSGCRSVIYRFFFCWPVKLVCCCWRSISVSISVSMCAQGALVVVDVVDFFFPKIFDKYNFFLSFFLILCTLYIYIVLITMMYRITMIHNKGACWAFFSPLLIYSYKVYLSIFNQQTATKKNPLIE